MAGRPQAKEVAPFQSNLVHDVKVKIFSYLTTEEKLMTASLVCKDWADVIQNDSRLWKTMEVTRHIPIQACVAQLEKSPSLKKLKVTGIYDDCEDILTAVATHCPNLEELIMIDCLITGDPMEAVAISCTKLVSCEFRDVDVSPCEKHLISIFSCCPQLQKLTMNEISYGSLRMYPSVSCATWNYPNLREMIIGFLPTEWQMLVLKRIGPQLERLHIGYVNVDAWILLAKCQGLKMLEIENSSDLTDSLLMNGIGQLSNLRYLSIPEAELVSPDVMKDFLSTKAVAGQLEELDLTGVYLNEDCLEVIARHCTRLLTLQITYNGGIKMSVLENFIDSMASNTLQTLHVSYMYDQLTQEFIGSCSREKELQVTFIQQAPIFVRVLQDDSSCYGSDSSSAVGWYFDSSGSDSN